MSHELEDLRARAAALRERIKRSNELVETGRFWRDPYDVAVSTKLLAMLDAWVAFASPPIDVPWWNRTGDFIAGGLEEGDI